MQIIWYISKSIIYLNEGEIKENMRLVYKLLIYSPVVHLIFLSNNRFFE